MPAGPGTCGTAGMKLVELDSLASEPHIEDDLVNRVGAIFERCPALQGFSIQDAAGRTRAPCLPGALSCGTCTSACQVHQRRVDPAENVATPRQDSTYAARARGAGPEAKPKPLTLEP